MKLPLTLPSYLCGECGIEMLLLTSVPSQERAASKTVTAACYTPRCPQKGVAITVGLVEVAATSFDEASAPSPQSALLSPQPVKES